jgi:hypothetical protein
MALSALLRSACSSHPLAHFRHLAGATGMLPKRYDDGTSGFLFLEPCPVLAKKEAAHWGRPQVWLSKNRRPIIHSKDVQTFNLECLLKDPPSRRRLADSPTELLRARPLSPEWHRRPWLESISLANGGLGQHPRHDGRKTSPDSITIDAIL